MAIQTKTQANKALRTRKLTGETFDALSASAKERVYQEFEELTPPKIKSKFRPLSAKKRVEHMRPKPSRSRGMLYGTRATRPWLASQFFISVDHSKQ